MICVHCAAISVRAERPLTAKLVKNPDITPAPTQISALCSQYFTEKELTLRIEAKITLIPTLKNAPPHSTA